MTIKKENIEWLIIIGGLWVSFFNIFTFLLFLVSLLLLLLQKEVGALKILNIITLRSIANPGIAVRINQYEAVKWIIVLGVSVYLALGYTKLKDEEIKKINPIIFWVLIYSLYSILASLYSSTLPTLATFKVISYTLPFLGVLIGVLRTYNTFNWIDWLYKLFALLVIVSIPFLKLPVGYLRNGHAFQALTQQPNTFGIFLVLFIALILTKYSYEQFKYTFYFYGLLALSVYFIILSESRTAFISAIILIMIFFFFKNTNRVKKIIIFNFVGVGLILYIVLNQNAFTFFNEFLMKGQESGDMLVSREDQIERLMNNFYRDPLFGSGFGVPVTRYKSFSFSFKSAIEPGNLFLAVLSYGGVIGFIFFILYMGKILVSSIKYYQYQIYLFLATVLVSMGEMIFFSTNNMAVWLYMFLAIYIIYIPKKFLNLQLEN